MCNIRCTVTNINKPLPNVHAIYGGRTMRNFTGIGLGNPFPLRNNALRGVCIKKFKRFFDTEMASRAGELYKAVCHVYKTMLVQPVQLTCFCKPMACHCDIIAEFVNDMYYKNNPDSEIKMYKTADMLVVPFYSSGYNYSYAFSILYDMSVMNNVRSNLHQLLHKCNERVLLIGYINDKPIYGLNVLPTNAAANVYDPEKHDFVEFDYTQIPLDIEYLKDSFKELAEHAELNDYESMSTCDEFASVIKENITLTNLTLES